MNHSERVGGRLVDGVQGLELVNDVVELVQLGIGEPHVDYERLAELPPGKQALVQELAHVLVVHVSVNFYENLRLKSRHRWKEDYWKLKQIFVSVKDDF